jgi:hypothetical protein
MKDMGIIEDFQNCHTCKFLESEGGDIVDYGSTTAMLPVVFNRTHEQADDVSDEEMTHLIDCEMSGNCKCWKGRAHFE